MCQKIWTCDQSESLKFHVGKCWESNSQIIVMKADFPNPFRTTPFITYLFCNSCWYRRISAARVTSPINSLSFNSLCTASVFASSRENLSSTWSNVRSLNLWRLRSPARKFLAGRSIEPSCYHIWAISGINYFENQYIYLVPEIDRWGF